MTSPEHRPIITNAWAPGRTDDDQPTMRLTSKRFDCACGQDCEQVQAWRKDAARAELARDLELLFKPKAAA